MFEIGETVSVTDEYYDFCGVIEKIENGKYAIRSVGTGILHFWIEVTSISKLP